MYRRYFNMPVLREFEELQREMNRLFSAYLPSTLRSPMGYPAMNIYTNEEEALITAELPGVNPEDLELSVINDTLTIKGERKEETLPEGACCYRQERTYGNFTRSIELPFKVDANKVKAVFEKGILTVTLPRAEEDKPKKIAVKAG